MRDKMEIEVRTALGIAQGIEQSIAALERWWVPSKRGSNGQRALDEIKEKRAALERCIMDALLSNNVPRAPD